MSSKEGISGVGLPPEQIGRGMEPINLAKGEISYELFPARVRAALHAGVDKSEMNQASVGPGLIALRTAVVERSNNRYGTNFDPDQVVITAGSTPAITTVLKQFDDRTTIVTADISYGDYAAEAKKLGMKVAHYRVDNDFSPNPDSIKEVLDREKNALLVLNTPSNPSGDVYRRRILEEIAEIVDTRPGVYVMSDEVFVEMRFDNEENPHIPFASIPGMQDRTYLINSVTKWGPFAGLRLGWVVAPEGKQDGILNSRGKVSTVPALMQFGAIPVVDGACDEDIRQSREDLRQRRDYMHAKLNGMGLPTALPPAAFFCIPDVSEFGGGDALEKRLREEFRLTTIAGSGYGERTGNRLRLSYAPSKEIVEAGMDRLEQAVTTIRTSS